MTIHFYFSERALLLNRAFVCLYQLFFVCLREIFNVMYTSIDVYGIGILISFIIFLSMFESHPEDLSKMFGITQKFNFYWILVLSFMMSVFWIVAFPLFIWCKSSENNKK